VERDCFNCEHEEVNLTDAPCLECVDRSGWKAKTAGGKDCITVTPEYASLYGVLMQAFKQAQDLKGRVRHAVDGENFEDQNICSITRQVGLGFPLGQAMKKTVESQRLGGERGVQELLGAAVYLCAAIIVMREKMETFQFCP